MNDNQERDERVRVLPIAGRLRPDGRLILDRPLAPPAPPRPSDPGEPQPR